MMDYMKSKAVWTGKICKVSDKLEIPDKKKRCLGSFFKSQGQTLPHSDWDSIELQLNSYLRTVDADGETTLPE